MNKKNGFLNFICAFIPGVGYMYNGLMKRGFEQLLLFFGIFAIVGYIQLDTLVMVLLIPIWFYNFFDTFNVKNAIERGVLVDDNFRIIHRDSSELNINMINNKMVGIGLIVIGALAIINKVSDILFSFRFGHQFYIVYSLIRQLMIPVLFIIIGLVLMGRTKNNKINKKDTEATIVLDKEGEIVLDKEKTIE